MSVGSEGDILIIVFIFVIGNKINGDFFFFSFNYFAFFKWSNRKGQSYCTLNPVSTSMDIPRTRSRRQTRGGSQPLVARPYPVPSSMSNGRWRCGHSSGRLRAREVSVRARERRGWHSGLGL